jgi:hypothetical protein
LFFEPTMTHTPLLSASSLSAAVVARSQSKKESILDLSRFMDKQIHVKFAGGREGLELRA